MGVGKDMTNGELGGFFKTMHCPKCPYNREHWDNCNKVDQVSQLFFSRIVGPSYLACFVKRYEPVRPLRSASQNLLMRSSVMPRTVTFGARVFAIYGPTLWNSIPNDLRCITTVSAFKNALKTFLFRQYYDFE